MPNLPNLHRLQSVLLIDLSHLCPGFDRSRAGNMEFDTDKACRTCQIFGGVPAFLVTCEVSWCNVFDRKAYTLITAVPVFAE